MKKQLTKIGKLFYRLSVFCDPIYAEHLKKSQIYENTIQELSQFMMETVNIIARWEQGNLTAVLSTNNDCLGAINDALNYLVQNLITEIKQLPNDSYLRHKYKIYEQALNIQKTVSHQQENSIIYDSINLEDCYDFDDLNDLDNVDDSDSYNYNYHLNNHKKDNLLIKIRDICGKILGKLFFRISILFDKKYLEHLQNSQNYEQRSENLSRQIIAILDVVEGWARFDFRERIEIRYIADFQDIANVLNKFIDNLTLELKKLPENSGFRQKIKI